MLLVSLLDATHYARAFNRVDKILILSINIQQHLFVNRESGLYHVLRWRLWKREVRVVMRLFEACFHGLLRVLVGPTIRIIWEEFANDRIQGEYALRN